MKQPLHSPLPNLVTPEMQSEANSIHDDLAQRISTSISPKIEEIRSRGWAIEVEYRIALTPPAYTEICSDCGVPHTRRDILDSLKDQRLHDIAQALSDLPTFNLEDLPTICENSTNKPN